MIDDILEEFDKIFDRSDLGHRRFHAYLQTLRCATKMTSAQAEGLVSYLKAKINKGYDNSLLHRTVLEDIIELLSS